MSVFRSGWVESSGGVLENQSYFSHHYHVKRLGDEWLNHRREMGGPLWSGMVGL